MPFVPHTENDVQAMLATIGVSDIDQLFDEIPAHIRSTGLNRVSEGVSEMEMLQKLTARADQDDAGVCFLGAGCYDHHIPAAVWDLTARGEFMTAYTPYQAEASQGTLQLIFEYQSMMAALTGMSVSNASVYDGASGLAEAALMAFRVNKKAKSRTILIPENVHPHYIDTTENIVTNQQIQVQRLPVSGGQLCIEDLAQAEEPFAALVISQPNFFGVIEDVDALTDWAHAQGALVIAVVNPLSLAMLKPPGQWGSEGADIVCGDGQPLGIPMSSGGPSFGFMCCREAYVRQMPGRIIGATEDTQGRTGYALTLQAREQHIRRGKATSNICTNQGLLVTAATIHMAIMGAQGLQQTAVASHRNARELVTALTAIKGVSVKYQDPYFQECVLELPASAGAVVDALLAEGVLGGLALGEYFAERENQLLVCATEKRTADDIQKYHLALKTVLDRLANGAGDAG